MSKPKHIFHLIGNAHLDPVWHWDWREGLNEGLITCRSILNMMDEYPDLTFSRGEVSIYEHIEATDPATFRRICRRIEEGRWEPVGGTYVQSDTNLPATETFIRQFLRGQRYFADRFGKQSRVSWFADSFGHTAGLPEIMAACGIQYFAFTRPNHGILPLPNPTFWWQATSGAKILCYRPMVGWYGTDRAEIITRFDGLLAEAANRQLLNVGAFYGLGNHGGGPTRRQLHDIQEWGARHPEVELRFSTMHRLFAALEKEWLTPQASALPVHKGEMNFCLRGCYSSLAKFKYAYRRAEAQVQRAGTTDAAIRSALRQKPASFTQIWDHVLFNSFHDILPGSSIERTYTEQLEWLGSATHAARTLEFNALNALAAQVNTSVEPPPAGDMPTGVSALLWNPHPQPYQGYIEVESRLDYRPIGKYWGKLNATPIRVLDARRRPLAFQRIRLEHNCLPMHPDPSHARLLLPVTLPATGWNVVEIAYLEGARDFPPPPRPAHVSRPGTITNNIYHVKANVGGESLQISYKGKPLFGRKGMGFVLTDDPWGSWGGMNEEPESLSLNTVRETWRITDVKTTERGPFRVALWVRFAGQRSRIDLTISVTRDRAAIDVSARIHWDERSARLKLVMPAGREATFEVPGGTAHRKPCGEVPGGRWVRITDGRKTFGFASDALYNFEIRDGEFNATLCRASRYSCDVTMPPDADLDMAATDNGELMLKFLLAAGDMNLSRLARDLEQPPIALLVAPHKGTLPRSGSFVQLAPTELTLLALKPAEKGAALVARIQNTSSGATRPRLTLGGRNIFLSKMKPGQISTWRLVLTKERWQATPITAIEA